MSKLIFVTGGVTSSLGKGIIVASLAKLLYSRGIDISFLKLDPYINIDPDTLNPYEHGECYVTQDGAVTDLDLGHYERFLNIPTSQKNNITTGRIYKKVMENERTGLYSGKTVQVIPHITNEIKRNIFKLCKKNNDEHIVIIEIGGTVGDIESLPYIEAVRQLIWELPRENTVFIHLTLIPYLTVAKEIKTKPTQHSVKLLNEHGIMPDIIVCRTERKLSDAVKQKIANFCNVHFDDVIEALDVDSIYKVPILLMKQNMDTICIQKLSINNTNNHNLDKWNVFLDKHSKLHQNITIGLIGKYTNLQDAYKSILESFVHAGVYNDCKVNVKYIDSTKIKKDNVHTFFEGIDGILVAPGFGKRGIEGKIFAIQYSRENQIPFLGICLGMQIACIEFARNVLSLTEANSTEFDPQCKEPIIDYLPEQNNNLLKGGTMRLGAYDCTLLPNTFTYSIYKQKKISERHRHRFEFNNKYLKKFKDNGFIPSGINSAIDLVEIFELSEHPFFIGVQFHPELKSTVENPHPLFITLVKKCLKNKLFPFKGDGKKIVYNQVPNSSSLSIRKKLS